MTPSVASARPRHAAGSTTPLSRPAGTPANRTGIMERGRCALLAAIALPALGIPAALHAQGTYNFSVHVMGLGMPPDHPALAQAHVFAYNIDNGDFAIQTGSGITTLADVPTSAYNPEWQLSVLYCPPELEFVGWSSVEMEYWNPFDYLDREGIMFFNPKPNIMAVAQFKLKTFALTVYIMGTYASYPYYDPVGSIFANGIPILQPTSLSYDPVFSEPIYFTSGTVVNLSAIATMPEYRFLHFGSHLGSPFDPPFFNDFYNTPPHPGVTMTSETTGAITMTQDQTILAVFAKEPVVTQYNYDPRFPVSMGSPPDCYYPYNLVTTPVWPSGSPHIVTPPQTIAPVSTNPNEAYFLVGWTNGTGHIPPSGAGTSVIIPSLWESSSLEWVWELRTEMEVSQYNCDPLLPNPALQCVTTNIWSGTSALVLAPSQTLVADPNDPGLTYSLAGWKNGTGDIPPAGAGTSVVIPQVTQSSSLEWVWTSGEPGEPDAGVTALTITDIRVGAADETTREVELDFSYEGTLDADRIRVRQWPGLGVNQPHEMLVPQNIAPLHAGDRATLLIHADAGADKAFFRIVSE